MRTRNHVPACQSALVRLGLRKVRQPQRVDITGLVPAAAGTVHPAGDHIEHVAEPLGDGARKVQGDPGPGHHHRAVRGGEIAGHLLDLGAREIASRCQIVERGVGDELAQFPYARCEFGAVLSMLEALVEDHLDHAQ